jgi:hypothetical protein
MVTITTRAASALSPGGCVCPATKRLVTRCGRRAKVNIMSDGSVLYVGNSLVGDLREASPDAAALNAVDAVEGGRGRA